MKLPSAVDVERALIGALITTKELFDYVNSHLTEDDFYEHHYKAIYREICTLEEQGIKADMISVSQSLKKTYGDEHFAYYTKMLDAMSDPQRVKSYEYMVAVIQQESKRRQVIELGNELMKGALDAHLDVADVLAKADREVSRITDIGMKTDYVHAKDVLEDVYEEVKKASSNTGDITGIPTLLDRLDSLTGGLHAPDLFVLAARPAMGKTALALTLASNISITQDYPVGFFTLEMSKEQLVKRLVSQIGSIRSDKLRNGELDSVDWTSFDEASARIINGNLYIDETPSLDLSEFKSKARKMVKQNGVRVIFIDYLQLMTVRGISNRQEEVATISRGLKAMAKELDIPIVALAQLNRGVEGREGLSGKRPRLSDLRESGAIEQDADIVAFIHRPEYYGYTIDEDNNDLKGVAEIIVAKHRNGATDDLRFRFKGEFTRFENLDDSINIIDTFTPSDVPF